MQNPAGAGLDHANSKRSELAPGAGFPPDLGRGFRGLPIQRKAFVTSQGDPFEREADAVADNVMDMKGPAAARVGNAAVQFKHTAVAQSAKPELDTGAAVRAAETGGAPLTGTLRSFFEPRFQRDFSQVRIHADGGAAAAARTVNARAYTFGPNIVFGRDEFAPQTDSGRRLLAHELTHVVQQTGGGPLVRDTPADLPSEGRGAVSKADVGPRAAAADVQQSSQQAIARAEPTGTELSKARADFVDKSRAGILERHGIGSATSLTESEINAAADAVVAATSGVTNDVALAFFKYYSNHKLRKMDADEEKNAQKPPGTFALTDPQGDTRLRSDVPAMPPARLGPLLIHELGHTNDSSNMMGSGDWQEGHAYGVEYFFSLRTGDAARQKDIVRIVGSGSLALPVFQPLLLQVFRETLATLIALQEVIQGGSSPHLPPHTPPDADAARRLTTERVEKSTPQSNDLKAITKYVKDHLATFTLPL